MVPGTLAATLKAGIKAQLLSIFTPFTSGLLAGELSQFSAAIDKLAEAIGSGDAPNTISHIQTNADIVLDTSDIDVSPGTFSNSGGPVTGVGESIAVTLTQKIE